MSLTRVDDVLRMTATPRSPLSGRRGLAMSGIPVPIKAYILGLLPQPASGNPRGQRLQAPASGLAVPSFGETYLA